MLENFTIKDILFLLLIVDAIYIAILLNIVIELKVIQKILKFKGE